MKALNLSNIVVVGFIPNFDPKKGYPEFASKTEAVVEPKPSKLKTVVITAKEPRVLTEYQAKRKRALKQAKKASKKSFKGFTDKVVFSAID